MLIWRSGHIGIVEIDDTWPLPKSAKQELTAPALYAIPTEFLTLTAPS